MEISDCMKILESQSSCLKFLSVQTKTPFKLSLEFVGTFKQKTGYLDKLMMKEMNIGGQKLIHCIINGNQTLKQLAVEEHTETNISLPVLLRGVKHWVGVFLNCSTLHIIQICLNNHIISKYGLYKARKYSSRVEIRLCFGNLKTTRKEISLDNDDAL